MSHSHVLTRIPYNVSQGNYCEQQISPASVQYHFVSNFGVNSRDYFQINYLEFSKEIICR